MYIGVDLGGTGIKAGLVDEKGNILHKDSCPTRAMEDYKVIVADMADLIKKILNDTDTNTSEIKTIGIGCPGSIDDKNGIVIYANNLNLHDAPLAQELKKYYDVPVYVSNDANCAALGEFFALDDENITDIVAITLGTGVGSGIIINKKIFTGTNGIGGELGHTVIKVNGEKCTCGRNGCWEAYASATALIREAEKAAKENPDSYLAKLVAENGGKANGRIPFAATEKGDEAGKKVIDKYILDVAEGIVNIINTFQPHAIVIGGGVSNAGGALLKPIEEYSKEHCYGGIFQTKISIAKLGNDAGIIGAAFLGK